MNDNRHSSLPEIYISSFLEHLLINLIVRSFSQQSWKLLLTNDFSFIFLYLWLRKQKNCTNTAKVQFHFYCTSILSNFYVYSLAQMILSFFFNSIESHSKKWMSDKQKWDWIIIGARIERSMNATVFNFMPTGIADKAQVKIKSRENTWSSNFSWWRAASCASSLFSPLLYRAPRETEFRSCPYQLI